MTESSKGCGVNNLTKAQAIALEKMKDPKIAALKKQLHNSVRPGKSATKKTCRTNSK